ncbi:ribonuclease H-like domain-containing protein [Tanacetum coccineum]
MKMRQYIAITDHILWDIITNGNQTTTDPASPSVSAPKTSLAANARRNNEKALNILLSAIPDRHLLSFHDAVDARSLWKAIKARFGGNEASKKMKKNLLKQQFETFTIGSREELDSAYERYTLAPQARECPLLLTMLLTPDEIICSFFSQQASMPTTHDDEDLLQIDEDAMEEIDIRWQVAMITARIRKFMRKTGRPIDLKPKNGITFDKSKIECFNCQKLGHFARECRFAKYQENRANGRQEKKIVTIEDSNSKALVATDNNEDIDWTKEFDAEPTTFAMMALTEVKQDDWSMEFDAEHVHFGQDGLVDDEETDVSKVQKKQAFTQRISETSFENSHKPFKTVLVQELGQGTWEQRGSRVPQAVLSRSTDGLYYPRMDNRRPRISSYSPLSRSSNPRTTYRPQRPKKTVKSIWVKKGSTVGSQAVLPQTISVKKSAMITSKQTWRQKGNYLDSVNRDNGSYTLKQFEYVTPLGVSKSVMTWVPKRVSLNSLTYCTGNPEEDLKIMPIIDSGGRISGKGTIKTSCLDFEKVSYVEELKFNLLSVSQICDKKHNVLFTDKECLILSPKFKFVDEDLKLVSLQRQQLRSYFYGTEDGACKSKNINSLVSRAIWLEVYLPRHLRLIIRVLHVTRGKQRRASLQKEEGDLLGYSTAAKVLGVYHSATMHPEECTAAKEVPLSSEEQALHDELMNLMHQESLVKAHNDDQRIAFEEEKRRTSIAKGKEHVQHTFTLILAKQYLLKCYTEEGGAADYNKMDPTIDVTSTPTLRIHKIHPQSQIIGKSTAGVQTRRKLKESTSDQHQALLLFIYKQNRTITKDQAKHACLACSISQRNPRKASQALANESWLIDARKLLQFKLTRCMEEVVLKLPPGFEDPLIQTRSTIFQGTYGPSSSPTSMGNERPFTFLVETCYRRGLLRKLCYLEGSEEDIMLSHKPASTPIEAHKSLRKDEEGEDVDVHTYRSMIVVPHDSPFHLEAFSDSDYAGDNHDRRSTSGGCQYLGRRLVSWQCKKQTIVAISSTEAEYVAAASCLSQSTVDAKSMLDYGLNS